MKINIGMSMLKYINLWVIDRVFSDAPAKLSSRSQILYIRALMFHWRDKEPSIAQAVAFEVLESDLPYEQNKKELAEMHKAGLITLTNNPQSYLFNNVWGKYIDREQLPKVNPETYSGLFSFKPIDHFEKDLPEQESMIELCCMKHKLNRTQVNFLIQLFITEQKSLKKQYNNISEVMKHCTSYVGYNSAKAPEASAVKSKGVLINKNLNTPGT